MSNGQMCATIKVEFNGEYPHKSMLERTYEVPYNVNFEEIIDSIMNIAKDYDIPISRAYLSGHILTTSNLWSKEQIENHFLKVVKTNEQINGINMKK